MAFGYPPPTATSKLRKNPRPTAARDPCPTGTLGAQNARIFQPMTFTFSAWAPSGCGSRYR
jgi:hypothetical protein